MLHSLSHIKRIWNGKSCCKSSFVAIFLGSALEFYQLSVPPACLGGTVVLTCIYVALWLTKQKS